MSPLTDERILIPKNRQSAKSGANDGYYKSLICPTIITRSMAGKNEK